MPGDPRRFAGLNFSPPLHSNPEGPLDCSKITLPPNFTVVVAGASTGIGLGISKSYARAKVSNLLLSSRSLDKLENAAKEILKINPRIKIVCQECDITNEQQVKELAEATKTAFGRLDVLVINAGLATKVAVKREGGLMDWPANFYEQPASEWDTLYRMNILGPFVLMQNFLPLLEGTADGAKAVVQLSSAAAHYVKSELMAASYSLTKMGSTRLVEMCHEGHHKNGIVAVAIQPGGVKTDMSASVPQGKGWEALLTESPELAGACAVWLTKERREWLSGRYIDSRWDFDELLKKKDMIVENDLLKFRMMVDAVPEDSSSQQTATGA